MRITTQTCKLDVNLDREQENSVIGYALSLAKEQAESAVEVAVDGRSIAEAVKRAAERKAKLAPAKKWPGHDPDAWNGFIIAECEECKDHRAFFTKKWLTETTCKKCGATTKLKDKAYAHLHCPSCGKTWTYRTNASGATVQAMCIECGAMLEAEWDYSDRCYKTKEE